MMEHDALGHAEPATPPLGGKGEVGMSGQDVGQPVEGERGLMRKYALPVRPEPHNG